MKILIVEDDAEQREVLVKALSYAKIPRKVDTTGFEITVAASRGSAEKILRTRDFDFVLLDFYLEDGHSSAEISHELSKKKVPHAFYTADEPLTKTGPVPRDVPVWPKAAVGVSMDLVTKICDYYQKFTERASNPGAETKFFGISLGGLKNRKAQ